MIKNLTSKYVLGDESRLYRHWMKLKPEYAEFVDEFDVVVLGANYGSGFRRGGGRSARSSSASRGAAAATCLTTTTT